MRILYDSKDKAYKDPFGVLTEKQDCRIRIRIPNTCPVRTVALSVKGDDGFLMKIPMSAVENDGVYTDYTVTFSLFRHGLYFYWFDVSAETSDFSLFRHSDGGTNMEAGAKWQLSCCPDYSGTQPNCGRNIYQIFPDRFYRSGIPDLSSKITPFTVHGNDSECPGWGPDGNGLWSRDFYGGNLRGITEKLEYLRTLSVDMIYLNPIFSAASNHRYDTADYRSVDPMLGTEEDFVKLCQKAHELGIKVVLDGVFSHTGSDSIYFDSENKYGHGAVSDPDSPYRSWYRFTSYPSEYDCWWGIRTLPCTNELDPSFLDFIIDGKDSVTEHWLRLGADGFRLDVADELPDMFIARLRKKMKQLKPDSVLFGEVWEDASNKISYSVRRKYFSDGLLDGVTNYPFRNAVIDLITERISPSDFAARIMDIAENYPKQALLCSMTILSTHDTERALTVLGDCPHNLSKELKATYRMSPEKRAFALTRMRAAALIQFTLPGNPCVYYGDEAGMEGYEDPFNRRFFPWNGAETDLTEFYRRLSGLRAENDILRFGGVSFDCYGKVLKMTRTYNGKSVHITVNLGDTPVTADIEGKLLFGSDGILGKYGFAVNEN